MFDISQKITIARAKQMNPVVLAYLGDGVHTLYVREKLAYNSDAKSGELNKREAEIVCATSQARAIAVLLPLFTLEETSIFKRARNSKKGSKAKNSSAGDYSKSTGFEAVMGYLYATGQLERLNYLLSAVYDADEGVGAKDSLPSGQASGYNANNNDDIQNTIDKCESEQTNLNESQQTDLKKSELNEKQSDAICAHSEKQGDNKNDG